MLTADSIYRFDNVELHPGSRQLRVEGQPAALGARAFDLLLALISHRERMLTKNELLDMVWPNLVVEENNLQVHVSALRKLLGPKAIVTIPGRGYRFAAALAQPPGAAPAVPAAAAPAMPVAAPASPVPATVAASGASGNLPAYLPPLWGREAELAVLCELVSQHRLLSLLGAGGIGKTSLARAVAAQEAHAFRDGAWMVELANISDPAALPAAVASAMGINLPGEGDATTELTERLRGQELLVLDNCEHLIGAAAALVRHLLAAVPGLHVLVTSQEPLKLAAEQAVRLDALAVPTEAELADAAAHGAVALFAARVSAVQPAFRLSDDNIDAVVEICRALDGMPLALEFAAARVPLLGLQGVRQHLGQRLRILNNGTRDAPSRHRTLRATLDWSHALLGVDEQKVFRRLGVFVGGFGLELAQQVAADDRIDAWAVLDHLGTLVDKSIVVAETGATPRYRLLETTRAYAREQLEAAGEWHALQKWHAQCMHKAIDRRARYARLGPESSDQWLLACSAEIDNLRSAIEWACAPVGDPALALDLVNTTAVLMYQAGRYPECVRWMQMAEPFIDEHTPAQVLAEFRLGLALVGLHGGVEAGRRLELLEQARAGFEQERSYVLLVMTLCMNTYVAGVRGEFDIAERCLAQCEPLLAHPELQMFRGLNLYVTGMVRRFQDRSADALDAFTRALPVVKAEGNARTLFYVRHNIAAMHGELGLLDEAATRFRELIEQLRASPLSDSQMLAFTHVWYAHALTRQGRLAEAQAQAMEGLPHCRRSTGIRHFAGMLAWLVACQGRLRDAALLIGCDDAARERRGEVRAPTDTRTLAATLALVGAVHPAAQIEAWRREGAELEEDAAAALISAGPA